MPQPATYRILVVDDDPVLLDLTGAVLSLAGHAVTALPSGDQALAALGADPAFDLVLTDLNMPGLEGPALARALRGRMAASTSLVGMSATSPAAETVVLFDAFLPKPFNPQDLLQIVQRVIQSHVRGAHAAPVTPEPQEASRSILDDVTLQSLARAIPPPQLRKLYEMGIADVEKRLLRMQEAVGTGDLATVKREAHAIKGSCGMVGALELQTLAAAIEDSTTLEASAMAQIAPACLRLRRMLDAKLQAV